MEKQLRGKFIVFEGLDGSGQTTQAGLLGDFFRDNGFKVLLTKEPSLSSSVGSKLRSVLRKEIEVEAEELQKLFVQDRKEHLEKIILPALQSGQMVICDRYIFSTLAYGKSDGLDLHWLMTINSKFPLPDTAFILKVSPAACIDRIEKRSKQKDLFETEEKLTKVWDTYKEMADRFPNCYIINGERPIEEVSAEIKKIIKEKLNI